MEKVLETVRFSDRHYWYKSIWHFDSKQMYNALSKSKVFTKDSDLKHLPCSLDLSRL